LIPINKHVIENLFSDGVLPTEDDSEDREDSSDSPEASGHRKKPKVAASSKKSSKMWKNAKLHIQQQDRDSDQSNSGSTISAIVSNVSQRSVSTTPILESAQLPVSACSSLPDTGEILGSLVVSGAALPSALGIAPEQLFISGVSQQSVSMTPVLESAQLPMSACSSLPDTGEILGSSVVGRAVLPSALGIAPEQLFVSDVS
jgi:hypothetical protein